MYGCIYVFICLLIYSKNTHFKQNISQKISLFLMIDHTDTLLICSLFIYLLVCLSNLVRTSKKLDSLSCLFISLFINLFVCLFTCQIILAIVFVLFDLLCSCQLCSLVRASAGLVGGEAIIGVKCSQKQ